MSQAGPRLKLSDMMPPSLTVCLVTSNIVNNDRPIKRECRNVLYCVHVCLCVAGGHYVHHHKCRAEFTKITDNGKWKWTQETAVFTTWLNQQLCEVIAALSFVQGQEDVGTGESVCFDSNWVLLIITHCHSTTLMTIYVLITTFRIK